MTSTEQECDWMGPLLVDYADRELDGPQAAEVAEHLGRCARCRQRVSDLHRSLEMARSIWQQAALGVSAPGLAPQVRRRPHRIPRLVTSGLAAACVVVAVGAAVWLHRPRAHVPPAPPPSLQQAEATIQRAETSARLLACADILADQPGCRQQAQDLYDYVARTYGDTGAAKRSPRTSHPAEQGVNQ